MITQIDIALNAQQPQRPLGPFNVPINSAVSATITNVPKPVGLRKVTGVTLTARNVNNEQTAVAATQIGAQWVATIPASFFDAVGNVSNGLQISASGTDERGVAVTTWRIGIGAVNVLAWSGEITPGSTGCVFNFHQSAPLRPVNGDCYANPQGNVCYYFNRSWHNMAAGYIARTDFAHLDENTSTMADIIRALKGTTAALFAVFALAGAAFGGVTVDKEQLKNIRGGEYVVTNVTYTGGGEGGITTNAVRDIVESYDYQPRIADYTTTGAVESIVESYGYLTEESDPLSLHTADTNSFAVGILTQSGRDCGAKIADATNAVTKVLKVTQGDAAWEYNGTEAVQIDLAQGGGTDGAAVTNIVASIFPSNRVFGVDGGLLSAYDVSADGVETNEIWREARGYAMTNGAWNVDQYDVGRWETRGLDGTITTITIGDAATAAAGVSVDLPSAWDAEARDFAVYVFNGAAVAAPLRLPTNATIYGYATSATNALKANAATALYFTEISRGTFLLGRAELTKVQEAAE